MVKIQLGLAQGEETHGVPVIELLYEFALGCACLHFILSARLGLLLRISTRGSSTASCLSRQMSLSGASLHLQTETAKMAHSSNYAPQFFPLREPPSNTLLQRGVEGVKRRRGWSANRLGSQPVGHGEGNGMLDAVPSRSEC